MKKELEMERRRTAIALSFGQHTCSASSQHAEAARAEPVRRTSSMSSMLLSDSVSQQKLQEQVPGALQNHVAG